MSQDFDIVCFSHLGWDSVFQRPQHLMTRWAREHRVFYVEGHVLDEGPAHMEIADRPGNVWVARPHRPTRLDDREAVALKRRLLDDLLTRYHVERFVLWYYDPLAIRFSAHLRPLAAVYDCMDELSAFAFAPPQLATCEARLFESVDLVFTGGASLNEHKRGRHPHVHLFPSGVDVAHFARARQPRSDPPDQAGTPRPLLGYFGVIDERCDYELLRRVAELRPDWHLVLVGPVMKVDPAKLPCAANVHYLGQRPYEELPDYIAGWDVALIPFAQSDATRFVSPTKTPEYLAAGKPVVSTPIRDVVSPYGEHGLVRIAGTPTAFVAAVAAALAEDPSGRTAAADALLATMSWDRTWAAMQDLVRRAVEAGDTRFAAEAGAAPEVITPHNERIEAGGHNEHREAGGHNGDIVLEVISAVAHTSRHPASDDGHVAPDDLRVAPAVPKPFTAGMVAPPPPVRRATATFDYLIVGAGFAGSVMAERLASELGMRVLVVERRSHLGGNAYDRYDDAGILIHQYGPHIFHTNSAEVFAYLSRFTDWRPYQHHVLASTDGQLVPFPINLDTLNQIYGLRLTSFEMEAFLRRVAEPRETIRTSEDVVVSRIGRELYEKFFKHYTRKQWGMDPSELEASVTARVPVRTNRDGRYFSDRYQAMPRHGYTRMFERMLAHPRIKLLLNAEYCEVRDLIPHRAVIYTGPIDEYFDYCYGRLPYRSLEFRFETLDTPRHQPVAVVNHPNDEAYTRVTEFKHLTGQRHARTTVVYEYPRADGDPYYPVPRPENAELYKRYKALASMALTATPGVHFVGRLATYKYYNMDQVVAQALTLFKAIARQAGAGHAMSRPPQSVGLADESAAVIPALAVYNPDDPASGPADGR